LDVFFSAACGRDEMTRHLRFRRAPARLPEVLSPGEVARLFEAVPRLRLKHK
jgi:hypothetical protein